MLIANPRSDVYPELVSFVTTDQRGDALIQLHQVHGDRVIILDNANNQGPYEADGLVTNRRQLPLRVSVADCGNIYAYDPVSQTIGIAHSGWRGTHKSIISNMIAAMTQL